MKRIVKISLLVVIALNACALPQFSFKAGGKGGEEIPGKTIQVDYFENRSALASANTSNVLTENLKDLMQSQTKLSLVSNNADWKIFGEITDYKVNPISIQANSEAAAQNRFTMTVVANCIYVTPENKDSVVIDNERITFYTDFSSSLDFSSQEESLQEEVIEQITQAIYDKAFGGSW
ncbi:MAG: LPS assembly lipoprotein LptE [Flavobacteriales bacterium]|jgi:hypothetical protein|nr:LPS assembly lipoprotein LptE [Flavobacteriales bacterium]